MITYKTTIKVPKSLLFTLLLGLFVFSAEILHAQAIGMINGTVTECSGTFSDDGFGSPYSPSDYVFTICPSTPGDVIQVSFVAFSLFTSPNPNNSDYLQIFDGPTTADNSLGDYTGGSLQGLPVTATVNNPTGCLTFSFNPSASSSGTFPGWEALIICTTPCAPPTGIAEIVDPQPLGIEQSVGVCIGQPVTVGDAGSFPESGFTLETWIWNWGDGDADTLFSPANATHSYSEPGEYIVSLSVYDNNDCRNLNLDPLQILVSTIPIFNTAFVSPICVGTSAEINGDPIQSVTWTALPPQVVAGETYLADGAGFQYSSTLTFDFFEPGATLDNCDDFLNLFVNIEHTYLGDLGFSITCPDGTQVLLLDWGQNGGGGTFLGNAVDNDPNNDPGVGFDYGWAPGLTNGNLDDQPFGDLVPVDGGPLGPNGNAVPSGFYESDNDMCQLVGCPLNGGWTFSVSDNLGADNGYIFSWGISFDPSLFPDVTTFTPVIGLQADSSYWEGPNIVNTSADGNLIEVLHDVPGSYDYTFYATNNFGCTFDTTVTLEVIEGPDITAGPDLIVCDVPVMLQAGLEGLEDASCDNSAGTFTYCYGEGANLIVTYCPDTPNDGITFMDFVINSGSLENFFDNMFVYDGPNTSSPLIAGPISGNLTGQSFSASNPSGCITWQLTSDGSVSCQSGSMPELNISVTCLGGGGLVWSWDPPTGLSDPNVQNPMVLVDQVTVYTVSAYPPQFPGCVVTDQVIVSPDPAADPGLDTDLILCFNEPTSTLLNYLDGTPAPGGVFTDNASGQVVPNSFTPSDYPNGTTVSYTYTVSNGVCIGTSELNIEILPSTNTDCCQTNALAGNDGIPCSLVYQLNGSIPVGVGTWSGPPNVTFSNINDPNAIASCTSPGGQIILTWTDSNGAFCEASDQLTVAFADTLSTIVVPNDALCNSECSGSAIAVVSGGTSSSGAYNYEWYSGEPGFTGFIRDLMCPGAHSVKITDFVGCTDSVTFEIGHPMPMPILVSAFAPLCADSCNGRIIITSAGATEYSFDGGETWQAENELLTCAGEYTVIARNENLCTASGVASLINPDKYTAAFNINPNPTTTENTLVTFQDVSYPGPVAKSEYRFGLNPILGTSDIRFSSFIFPSDTAGTYEIRLISTSVNGCIDTLSQDLVIREELLWFIPNSFSPNNDGINEIWRPIAQVADFRDYRVSIFDRWGREVFSTTNYEQGWNGGVKGSDYFVEAGIYTYLIKVSSSTTEDKFEFTGFITVLR